MTRVQVLAALLLSLALLACDDQDKSSSASPAATPAVQPSGSPVPSPSGTPAPTPTPIPTPTPESVPTTGDSSCIDSRVSSANRTVVERVCVLVNQERNKVGLMPLVLNAKLSDVAQAHAEDMVNRNYFSHNTPEGLSPFDRMHAAGISYQTAGENIAYWYKTPEEVMQTWMNSTGHRANILKAQYGKIGIGYDQNYWVQDFTN